MDMEIQVVQPTTYGCTTNPETVLSQPTYTQQKNDTHYRMIRAGLSTFGRVSDTRSIRNQ